MSKIVTIPNCSNPFVVIVNGVEYSYPAGQTVEVPDFIAAVIENHVNSHPQPAPPEPGVPSGSSVQSDWNQTDESQPDFIRNKPFGDVYGDAVTYDGNTGVPNVLGMLFKVSDASPIYADFEKGGSITVNGQKIAFTSDDFTEGEIVSPEGLIALFELVMIVPPELAGEELESLGGIAFPEAGTYFMWSANAVFVTSLQLNGYNGFLQAAQINKKYIPKVDFSDIAIPTFYMKQTESDPRYLYMDIECTEKATIEQVPDSLIFRVGLSTGGSVLLWLLPVMAHPKLFAQAFGYNQVEILYGSTFYTLYTAEYVPES